MRSKHKIRNIFLGSLVLTLAGVLTVSCGKKSDDNSPKISPKYILSGTKQDSDAIFDYYDIGDNELAVSLKDDIKETHTQAITIPSTHTVTEGGQQVAKTVTGIWHNAFHNCPATTVVLTNNITTIDFEAFLYSGITTITIPYSIDDIGDAAFYTCKNLTSVKFVNSDQDGVGNACSCEEPGQQQQQANPVYSSITLIPSFCFFNCSALTDLALPASITEIGEDAFNGCACLESALFFQNITTIRARAFEGCYALRTVYISKSLFASANNIGIEPHAFNYCHDNLDIVFCGTQLNVEAWVANHPIWGWKNNTGDPDLAVNKYSYRLETSESYFSTEWTYTYSIREGVPEVTITKYNGSVPTEGFISIPNSMPFPEGNKVVRIDKGTFSDVVKIALKRIYLPTTLLAIESLMFRKGYDNLYVVDDNTRCAFDKALVDSDREAEIEGRIDLSGITNLEFIGIRAFSGIGVHHISGTQNTFSMSYVANINIKTLHLPARIRAIGNEAFGIFKRRMLPYVDKFLWDYDDTYSCLEVIGTDAFYALGYSENENTEITGNEKRKSHTSSTIIFSRKFKHFGFLDSDRTRYNTSEAGRTNLFNFNDNTVYVSSKDDERANKQARPAHAFAGCSLLGKVIFKGDANDTNNTEDLVIALQSFVYNESLRTIVFEERKGHFIDFHTQSGSPNWHYAQESIGGNGGSGGNDFRGEPFLQTFVLPNQVTTLKIQNFAFHGNSRAVIYLSGTYGTNMYYDNTSGLWVSMNFGSSPLANAIQWRTIGDESWYNKTKESKDNKYYGYCFSSANNVNKTGDNSINYFGINQEIPVYDNVHYKEVINDPNNAATTDETTNCNNLTVEVGTTGAGRKEYVEKDYCAFVLEDLAGPTYKATMTNYLYSLYDDKTSAEKVTARVPESVTSSHSGESHDYIVKKIGDSAFSACFCDGKDTNPTKTVGQFNDLTNIELPNTIEEIGEYAFIRAYGVQKISSYTGNSAATEGMPSSLRYIGKNAFTFCGIKQILNIPYECKFYENYEKNVDTHKTTSVFSNSVDLRKITFVNGSGQGNSASSYYYSTTQYTSTKDSTTYTCALYSRNVSTDPNGAAIKDNKGENTTWHNGNRLLLVLNRDYNDRKDTSPDASLNTGSTGLVFNGKYKQDAQGHGIPFLYGAYKMGYWIKELIAGTPTQDSSSNTYPQPMFSAIGSRSDANKTLTVTYIYMGVAMNTYDATGNKNTYCDLSTISGDILRLPDYATNGCENLNTVELPNETDAKIPEGLFANNDKTNTNYKTTDPAATNGATAGYLDLRGTGYQAIGKDAFKNNKSIYHFIAPNVANFTIGESAFEGCTNLADIYLGAVTGTITINAKAFKDCTALASITWPASATVKIIGRNEANNADVGEIFSGCTALTSVELPVGLYSKIGLNDFYNCKNLTSVTCAGDLSITSIEAYAFQGCAKLDTFDFDHMPSLTTIGESAFAVISTDNYSSGVGKLVNVGATDVTTLPASLTTIGTSAFNGSDIVTVVIQSSSITMKTFAFASCTHLTAVRFTNPACTWGSGSGSGIFNSCTSLTELQLPIGYALDNSGSSIMTGDSSIKIYTYKQYTGAGATETWRTTSTGVAKPICYNVTSVQDLLDNGVITSSPSVANTTTEFWYLNASGVAVYLGTVTGYNGTTVTFSTGYTLTGTTFTAP